ncbi:MAG: polysaccharide biosynthesis protein [Bacteroidales bacterium]|nr:polysaccharide biosynthesis protein [Bacteroidales bacterium]
MDVVLSVLASMLVLLLTYLLVPEFLSGNRLFSLIWILSSFVSSVVLFLAVKTYTIIIRHTTFKDIVRFALALAGKVALMAVALLAFTISHAIGNVVVVMLFADLLVSLLLLVGVRLLMIAAYDIYKSHVREIQKCTRVLVYGTSEKTLSAITRFRNSPHYSLVGVITPDRSIDGVKFADKPVYAFEKSEDIDRLALKLSCSAILFTRKDEARQENERLIRFCNKSGLKVLILPEVGELGEVSSSIREVKIEDLLGREEITISMGEIRSGFAGKVVMVTGAAGSIGSELCRLLATLKVERLILFDNAETPMHNLRLELEENYPSLEFVPVIGDVRSLPRLDFAFRHYRPQVVFHAAAYKHVPLMEENPCEAIMVNLAGTRHVADKCIEYDVDKMVMISTDKAVNPTNIMGCSKRLAEIYVQSLGLAIEEGRHQGRTRFVTTRFGNVLGSNGSVIPRFRAQIEKGGPVTVTHPDITRFFMTIPEACRLVMQAAIMDTANKICVFDMGQPVKIDTLARRMIELSGKTVDVDIKIEYSGLRPGEKLYEEVLSNAENTIPTNHGRIRIAKVRTYDYKDALEAENRLEEFGSKVDIPSMVKLMKQVVPEFISKNSRFAEFDK